jgi:hypothetical protein
MTSTGSCGWQQAFIRVQRMVMACSRTISLRGIDTGPQVQAEVLKGTTRIKDGLPVIGGVIGYLSHSSMTSLHSREPPGTFHWDLSDHFR